MQAIFAGGVLTPALTASPGRFRFLALEKCGSGRRQAAPPPAMPVIDQNFAATLKKMTDGKPAIRERQMKSLEERYDLSNRPSADAKMDRTKPLQEGVRTKLPEGVTWEALVDMSAADIKQKGAFPKGFQPLPHPFHEEGGMVFPKFQIDEIKKQEERDLTRFDVDMDIPEHFLPEFPPAIYLTSRTDLGDVSKGQLVTIENFYQIFDGILNPKQIEAFAFWSRRLVSSNSVDSGSAHRQSQQGVLVLTVMPTCHQWGNSPGGRCATARISSSHRNAHGEGQHSRLFGSQRRSRQSKTSRNSNSGRYFDGDRS